MLDRYRGLTGRLFRGLLLLVRTTDQRKKHNTRYQNKCPRQRKRERGMKIQENYRRQGKDRHCKVHAYTWQDTTSYSLHLSECQFV